MYIAERCNQDCVFCLEVDGSWTPFVDPTTRQVVDQIDRLRSRGADQITFMGGETFFRKDLPQIITHAKSIQYKRVGVVTNGTVLSKKGFIGNLLDAGLDFMEFSIHGHTVELANAIARTHYSFERQTAALEEVNEFGGPPTIINTVVCRPNKDHLKDVAAYVLSKLTRVPVRFKFKFVSVTGLAEAQQASGEGIHYEDVDIEPVATFLEERGVPFWFYNFPLCRLGRFAGHAHETAAMGANETYFDYDHRAEEGYYDSGNQIEGRVWPEKSCSSCTVRAICPGLEDTYRRQSGADALSPRSDEPLPILRDAIKDRGGDPSEAEARLQRLARDPRPGRLVVQRRGPNFLRYLHPQEPHPLDISIVELQEGQKAFVTAGKFGLSYEPWENEPRLLRRPRVAAQMEATGNAMEHTAAAGGSLADVLKAARAATAEGWTCEAATPGASYAAAFVNLKIGSAASPLQLGA
jgi:MoaA/NifB/PqqE/SkfB family radical SAM enzyme